MFYEANDHPRHAADAKLIQSNPEHPQIPEHRLIPIQYITKTRNFKSETLLSVATNIAVRFYFYINSVFIVISFDYPIDKKATCIYN